MLEEAFLQNILEQPDDDLVRLAYADWLLERGGDESTARGELIQLQCQLARRAEGGPGEWTVPLAALLDRERALLDAHGQRWSGPVRALFPDCEFRRGFVEVVSAVGDRFVRHADALFRLAPIRRVRFLTHVTKDLAASPHLGRLAELDFERRAIGNAGVRTLLGGRSLPRLRVLDVSHCWISDDGARALAESPILGQLTTLNLGHNRLTIEGVRLLFTSKHWKGTCELVLAGNSLIDLPSVQRLGESLGEDQGPRVLRSLLHFASRKELDYSSAPVRELAHRASAGQPAQALGEGLRASHRKVRCAAAQMLARLGPEALPSVPLLVQRLFENNQLVRDHAAPALARLLPALPAELQNWLCLLANPQNTPLTNLRNTIHHARLPQAVREDFALVCARRIAWRKHVAAGKTGPAPAPSPATVDRSAHAINEMIGALGSLAEDHARQHRSSTSSQVARDKEHAWLLARLCELLIAT